VKTDMKQQIIETIRPRHVICHGTSWWWQKKTISVVQTPGTRLQGS